jgi:arginine/lysine/ornithine decarboxylase
VRDRTEQVLLADLDGRTGAVTCLLYPPGIPVVVPARRAVRRAGPADCVVE